MADDTRHVLPATPPELKELAEKIRHSRLTTPIGKPTGTTKTGRKRRAKVSPRTWAEIETLYAAGDLSKRDLALRFSITPVAIDRHMRKAGITFASKAREIAAAAKVATEKAIIDDATVLAGRIKETRDQHYQMSANLAKLVWAEILEARKNGHPVGAVLPNIKALQLAANALKQCREERFAVLGLDRPDAQDPSEIPELIVQELTAEQVEALRHAADESVMSIEPLDDGAPVSPARDMSDDDDDIVSEGDDGAD